MKHINEYSSFRKSLLEAKGYYIKVAIRDAKKALSILDDLHRRHFDISGSDTYYFKDEDMAFDAKMDLAARDIEIIDTNIEESNKLNESVIGIKTDRDFKGKDLITALDKAKIKYKMNRLSMTLTVLNLDKKYYDDAKQVIDDVGLTVMMAKESFITEKAKDSTEQLGIDLEAMVHDATSNGMTAKVQSTDKVWDDGVPVLKYIARSSKKSMKLPKKFKVVDDTEYGWWYFEDRGTWYGIDQDDYGTPPFEY